jgi:hypothetical protein
MVSKDIKYVTQSKEDFINQHKDVTVTFDSYYKYKFYFKSNPFSRLGLLTMGYGVMVGIVVTSTDLR